MLIIVMPREVKEATIHGKFRGAAQFHALAGREASPSFAGTRAMCGPD
jgi:hypothetical protein